MSRPESVEYHPLIRDLPEEERPRERLERYGAAALSNSELLAILLRVGVEGQSAVTLAQAILVQFGGLAGLARASISELCRMRGLGLAKAVQIKAALELGRRLLAASPEERPQIKSPADAANLVMLEMSLLPQEEFWVILLDTRNNVLGIDKLYKGSLNSSLIRIGEVFRGAIRQNCAAIIPVHNHPSGDPTPSPEDVLVTRQIVQAGELLDIEVLDHLIIGQQRYVSLKERGMGFNKG